MDIDIDISKRFKAQNIDINIDIRRRLAHGIKCKEVHTLCRKTGVLDPSHKCCSSDN